MTEQTLPNPAPTAATEVPVITAAGKRFELRITYGLAKKLRTADAGDLLGSTVADSVAALLYDLEKVGQAVWILIEAQAHQAGVTEEQIIDSLEPADIVAMREALRLAVLNFIRLVRSELSQAVEKVLAKREKIEQQKAAAVIQYVESDRIDRRIDKATRELLDQVDNRLDRDLQQVVTRTLDSLDEPSSKPSGK